MSEQTWTRHAVRTPAGCIELRARGEGPLVVFLPSLGRDSEDFDAIATPIAEAGYRVALPAPRGIGGSTGPLQGLTLHDWAADVAAVIDAEGGAPAVVVGHAGGNWIARAAAADRPDLVRAVVLLAAGHQQIPQQATTGLQRCLDLNLPDAQRMPSLQSTFFAPGNDASVWLHGWYPEVARSLRAAKAATPVAEWWTAGVAPVLDVQAENDAFLPIESSHLLKSELGDRVTVARIANAGHALLPEQPAAVTEAILTFLQALDIPRK